MKADVSAAFAGSHLGRHNDVDQDSTAFLHDTEDLSVGMSATTFQESKRKEERKAERTIRKLEIMLSEVTLGGAEHGVDVRDFAVVGKPHTHLTITGALHYTHTGASTLASYLDIFPPTLLEASPVVLNVYVDNAMRYGHTSLDFTKLNHFLASFATCLDRRGSSHTSFQTLQLHFFTHRVGASDPIFHDILYPIAKIPTGTTLVLKGLEAKLQGRLLELRSGDVAGRDTLGGWLRLRSELMANGETGWKAKFGVASVDLMVGGGGGRLC
ncbi:hypothetical protein CLAFUW4_09686 [Fulvia fulva]|uniref:Uncharacterized protein n=1 Tax=Passalora fulva TaxID=5499 RepID=A0A9Q8PHB7_PASFU|nr:uncharacterized protein CLAFUR5_09780 [Fulvia fulva]KAK4613555.1 hypothetical protein CLAFUR4_09691 [Fulvia fulva]UJO22432.1 hypothetical protein CLAFUR5_09780 [Fulvia fulva]WPV20451.1 hypothetical protein CLAFUW4_09686 [Fulvia fulva]WPV34872.1 hypothetical protein CLAFUW7_09687 [Fulvia fulva]